MLTALAEKADACDYLDEIGFMLCAFKHTGACALIHLPLDQDEKCSTACQDLAYQGSVSIDVLRIFPL